MAFKLHAKYNWNVFYPNLYTFKCPSNCFIKVNAFLTLRDGSPHAL